MKKTKLILGNTSGDTANYHQVENTNKLPYLGTLTISQSNNVGYYRLGSGEDGLHFCLTNKPKWFHRKMTKLCLGWEWVDNK
jgi:hypothetical protein